MTSNGIPRQSRMFSFSKKYDNYEFCFILNFVILLSYLVKNVSALHQTTLNLQDPFSDLASNQLSSLSNQTDLENLQNSLEQNLLSNNDQFNSKKSNLDQLNNSPNSPLILPNFPNVQSNLWSIPMNSLEKPNIQNTNQNLDFQTPNQNPSTIISSQPLNPSISSQFLNSQQINNPLTNPSSTSSSSSSISNLQSSRPFLNQPTSNHLFNNNANNLNHHNHHNLNPLTNLNGNNNLNNHQLGQNVNQNNFQKKLQNNQEQLNSLNSINSINHNLFGGAFSSLSNLPASTKLRSLTNTESDMLDFKNKNAFNNRKHHLRGNLNINENSLSNFLLNNKRNIQSNSWQQLGTAAKLKSNSNEDVFKSDYSINKFIPNRMQTDDYEDSNEEDNLKNTNNANINSNMNGNSNFQSVPNDHDSEDEDNFSDAFNNNETPNLNPLDVSSNSKGKKNLNSADPMNLLLYNKYNQLNLDSNSPKQKMNSIGNSQFPSNNGNQPYYVILPQLPSNNLDELFDSSLDSPPPVHQQKRRKSSNKPNKPLSWWQKLIPERLRLQQQANQQHQGSGEATSSEENQSNESSRYKDTKFKTSYLKAPSGESDLFTEVYGTGLQPNLPLPVFQPMSASQLLQALPYQHGASQYAGQAGVLGLPGGSLASSGSSPLFGQTGGDGEPSEEEAQAEEDVEEDEGHSSSQNPTLADRMKKWWNNIFAKNAPNNNSNNNNNNQQQQESARKSASKLSPKILII